MLLQAELTPEILLERLVALLTDRERLRAMSVRARAMGKPGALERIGAMAVELARRSSASECMRMVSAGCLKD